MLRRLRMGLGVLGLVCVAGLAAGSCGPAPEFIDSDYVVTCKEWPIAVCSETADCYDETRLVYELGTECIEGHCLCPVEGWIMCNKKGHPPDNNMRQCWPAEECEPGEMCAAEVPPPPPPPPPPEPECSEGDVSKCPGPVDKRCGVATCNEGVCGLKITPGPVASQKAGDCRRVECTTEGSVIELEDPSDYYDDGAECTFDICIDGSSQPLTILKTICPESGEGLCFEGECVQCIDNSDCSVVKACVGGRCIPNSCANGQFDAPQETDADCGGECLPCDAGEACMGNSDCKSHICKNKVCLAPTCDDKEKNDGETDTDCGAVCKSAQKLCIEGQSCKSGADCESNVCWAGACQAPTCSDGVQNPGETGIDCGGDCATECSPARGLVHPDSRP